MDIFLIILFTAALVLILILLLMLYNYRQHKKHVLQISQSQKMESLGRLAGGVAHDFNNMLAGIQGAAEYIRMNNTPKEREKYAKYLDIIIKACRRASHLTSQLLVFSREKERNFEPLNFNDLIKDAVLLLEHGVSKKIKITTKFNANNSCVEANRDLIQNMLLNLGFNARDAMPKGGTIKIETKNVEIIQEQIQNYLIKVKNGTYLELSVKDSGCGIPSENLHKIFEPFFTTKSIGKGTGLGLAAVYGIIREHHGTIKVDTSPKGTIFKVYFPISKASFCEESEPIAPSPVSAKIMLVDDEKILSELLKDILQSLGCSVTAFTDPQEALHHYQKNNNYDVVMLDVLMPKFSGVELFAKLKKITPNLKVIFMSGYSKDTEVEKIVENNIQTAFIKKPYNIAELSEKLRGLL